MKRVMNFNPRYKEYLDYLDDHIEAVISSWEDILRPALEEADEPLVQNINLDEIGLQVYNHDQSKYSSEEFTAYCNHWYPPDGLDVAHGSEKPQGDSDYDYAWVHHRNNNPHHSQYWLSVEDDGEIRALDMPIKYILEMLCDWHSFSRNKDEDTAYDWWVANRDTFIMSEKTIQCVDTLVQYMQTPLYLV